jgi:hypothetical protein
MRLRTKVLAKNSEANIPSESAFDLVVKSMFMEASGLICSKVINEYDNVKRGA